MKRKPEQNIQELWENFKGIHTTNWNTIVKKSFFKEWKTKSIEAILAENFPKLAVDTKHTSKKLQEHGIRQYQQTYT